MYEVITFTYVCYYSLFARSSEIFRSYVYFNIENILKNPIDYKMLRYLYPYIYIIEEHRSDGFQNIEHCFYYVSKNHSILCW